MQRSMTSARSMNSGRGPTDECNRRRIVLRTPNEEAACGGLHLAFAYHIPTSLSIKSLTSFLFI
jgi:hypothetical protein